ncbi:hypothetical protein [Azospirillum sp.]
MFVPADPSFDPRVRASFALRTFMRTLGVRMTILATVMGMRGLEEA